MGLLWRNRFCIGVKRDNEYRCGGDAGEDAKSKAVELLVEAVERMRRWRVWETWWVDEVMDEWLIARDRLETQLRGKYSDDVVNAITGLVDKFINYNERFLNYWREVSNEVRKLIEDLTNGRAEVVIRGENATGVSVHYEHVTLETDSTNIGGVTVKLVLNGLKGMTIKVSDVFRKAMSRREYRRFIRKVLRALKGGFEETDGRIEEGKATMGTTQTWQVIVWSLLYPGDNYVHVDAVNINEGGVTITWHLRTGHRPLKGKILGNVDKLGEEELLAFTLTAVLGDGWADVVKTIKNGRVYDEAVITITMSSEKFKAWEPLFERLKSMGFRSSEPYSEGNAVKIPFYGSNAIDLAKAMINILPPILRDVLDALAFEKWERIKRIAEMEVKFRIGESQINVTGYKFTVEVHEGTVALVHRARDGVEADEVINALKVNYGDEFHAHVNRSGKYLVVRIPMYEFEKHDDIKAQVIEVLRRKLEKTKDEKKKQIITKHLTRLTTPTKGAAAANHLEDPLALTQLQGKYGTEEMV